MTIQLLKYIAAVAEAGSITEAAKTMHISQPSLSAALKEAEKELGFGIFTRSRSGVALTKEGVEFLGYARQVIQEMGLLIQKFYMKHYRVINVILALTLLECIWSMLKA